MLVFSLRIASREFSNFGPTIEMHIIILLLLSHQSVGHFQFVYCVHGHNYVQNNFEHFLTVNFYWLYA